MEAIRSTNATQTTNLPQSEAADSYSSSEKEGHTNDNYFYTPDINYRNDDYSEVDYSDDVDCSSNSNSSSDSDCDYTDYFCFYNRRKRVRQVEPIAIDAAATTSYEWFRCLLIVYVVF